MSAPSNQAQIAVKEFKKSASSSKPIQCKLLYAKKGEKNDNSIAGVFISGINEDAASRDVTIADEALNRQLPIGTPQYQAIQVNAAPLAAEGASPAQNFRKALKEAKVQEGLEDFLIEAVRPGGTLYGPAASLIGVAFNGSYVPQNTNSFGQINLQVQTDGSVTITNIYTIGYMKNEDLFNPDNPEVTQITTRIVHEIKMKEGKPVARIVNRVVDVAGTNEQDLNTMGVLLSAQLKLPFKHKTKKINNKALLDAAALGNIDAVKALLAAGVQKNVVDHNGETALHCAARYGKENVIAYLLTQSSTDKLRNTDQSIALFYAAKFEQAELIRFLIQKGVNVNVREGHGKTPLHYAAETGNLDVINILVNAGAKVEAADNQGNPPLHYAAEAGNVGVIEILIQAGAKVEAADNQGKTALHYAAEAGNVGVIEILIKAGAKVEAADNQGKTPLHYAAENGNAEAVFQLIQDGANVNCQEHTTKKTPFHYVAEFGNTETVNLFILAGGELTSADAEGKTALHYSVKNGNTDILASLVKAGADVNGKELTTNKTPLHCAVEAKNIEAVKCLITYGANVNLRDSSGKTAVDYAFDSEHEGLIQLLTPIVLEDIRCRKIDGSSSTGDISEFPTPHNFEAQTYVDLQRDADVITLSTTSGAPSQTLRQLVPGLSIHNHEMNESQQMQAIKKVLLDAGIQEKVVRALIETFNQGNLYAQLETNIWPSLMSQREDYRGYLLYNKTFHHDIQPIEDGGIRITATLKAQAVDMDNIEKTWAIIDGLSTVTIKMVEGAVVFQIEKIEVNVKEAVVDETDQKEMRERVIELRDRILDGLYAKADLFIKARAGSVGPIEDAIAKGMLTADNVDTQDRAGKTLLHHATKRGHLDIVALLLARGAKDNILDAVEETAETYLAKHVNADPNMWAIIKILKNPQAQENINIQNKHGQTALHFAALAGNSDLVDALLTAGASVTLSDKDGRIPLHCAAAAGNTEAFEILLNKSLEIGADIKAKDKEEKTALHYAAENGHVAAINVLFLVGLDRNQKDSEGQTALHYAVSEEKEDAVSLLLKCDSDVNLQNAKRQSALHCAAKTGDTAILRILLAAGATVTLEDYHKKTALHYAAEYGDVAAIHALLQKNKNIINSQDSRGKTALHYAVSRKEPSVLKALVELGADINCTDDQGKTVLHYAVEANIKLSLNFLLGTSIQLSARDKSGLTALHSAVVAGNIHHMRALLEAGVKTDSRDNNGKTALHYAVEKGNAELVKVLIAARVSIDLQDAQGKTVLHYAVEKGNVELVKALIAARVSVDLQDAQGKTALDYVTKPEMVDILIEAGANINHQDAQGKTVLHYAVEKGNVELVKTLLAAGVDKDPKDISEQTPLHYAVERGNLEIVKGLLGKQADVNVKNFLSETPLHYAVRKGNSEMVEALLANGAEATVSAAQNKTPLHYAAEKGNLEIAQSLIAKGADIEASSFENGTILQCADKNEHSSIVDLYFNTRRAMASSSGHISGENVNNLDSANKTMLYYALKNGLTKHAAFLIENGANLHQIDKGLWDIKDKDGKTVLSYISQTKYLNNILSAIYDNPIEKTLLHYAAEAGNLELIKQLLIIKKRLGDEAVGLDVVTAGGQTALHYAVIAYTKAVEKLGQENQGSVQQRDNEKNRRLADANNAEAIILALVDAGANVLVKAHTGLRAWDSVPEEGAMKTYLYLVTRIDGYIQHLEQSKDKQQPQRLAAVKQLRESLVGKMGEEASLVVRLSNFKRAYMDYRNNSENQPKDGFFSQMSSMLKRAIFGSTQEIIKPTGRQTHAEAFAASMEGIKDTIATILKENTDAEPIKIAAEVVVPESVAEVRSDEPCHSFEIQEDPNELTPPLVSGMRSSSADDTEVVTQEAVAVPVEQSVSAVQYPTDYLLVAAENSVAPKIIPTAENLYLPGYEGDSELDDALYDGLNDELDLDPSLSKNIKEWINEESKDNEVLIRSGYGHGGQGFLNHQVHDTAQIQPAAVLGGVPAFVKGEEP